jgi:hypothetical protein
MKENDVDVLLKKRQLPFIYEDEVGFWNINLSLSKKKKIKQITKKFKKNMLILKKHKFEIPHTQVEYTLYDFFREFEW